MSNELAIVPRTFQEVESMAATLSKSDLLPQALKGKIPDLVFSILCGSELGLSPIASIRGIHIISGRPVLAADTMMGLVLGSGLAEYFVEVESSVTSSTFETKRKGAPRPQRCTWTMEDAKRAGVASKGTWLQFPRQMLAARAKAELARSAYPDILAGVHDPDEVSATSMVTTTPASTVIADVDAVEAEFTDVPADPALRAVEAIESAASLEALQLVAKSIIDLKLTGAAKEQMTAKYKARQAELRAAAQPVPVATSVPGVGECVA